MLKPRSCSTYLLGRSHASRSRPPDCVRQRIVDLSRTRYAGAKVLLYEPFEGVAAIYYGGAELNNSVVDFPAETNSSGNYADIFDWL